MPSATTTWKPLQEHKFSLDDEVRAMHEGTTREQAALLQQLQQNECYTRIFYIEDNPNNTTPLDNYISCLRQAGLDIGKGEAEYGYKMPIPEKEAGQRQLIIFRRR
ncbi:MAG: hypothetical protein WC595_02235 [Candidatus Nanoarchaeia archaeon]